ncbi:hypothetical protein FKM82_030640 [Ascaphus truei]
MDLSVCGDVTFYTRNSFFILQGIRGHGVARLCAPVLGGIRGHGVARLCHRFSSLLICLACEVGAFMCGVRAGGHLICYPYVSLLHTDIYQHFNSSLWEVNGLNSRIMGKTTVSDVKNLKCDIFSYKKHT